MDLKFNSFSVISNTLGSLFWVCISEAEWEHQDIESQSRNQGNKLKWAMLKSKSISQIRIVVYCEIFKRSKQNK